MKSLIISLAFLSAMPLALNAARTATSEEVIQELQAQRRVLEKRIQEQAATIAQLKEQYDQCVQGQVLQEEPKRKKPKQ